MPKIKRGKPLHPRKTDTPDQITSRDILVVSDRALNPDNQSNRVIIRVCQWTRQPAPVLEVRRCYRRKDGTSRWERLRGITLDDLRIIADPANQQRIIAALQST